MDYPWVDEFFPNALDTWINSKCRGKDRGSKQKKMPGLCYIRYQTEEECLRLMEKNKDLLFQGKPLHMRLVPKSEDDSEQVIRDNQNHPIGEQVASLPHSEVPDKNVIAGSGDYTDTITVQSVTTENVVQSVTILPHGSIVDTNGNIKQVSYKSETVIQMADSEMNQAITNIVNEYTVSAAQSNNNHDSESFLMNMFTEGSSVDVSNIMEEAVDVLKQSGACLREKENDSEAAVTGIIQVEQISSNELSIVNTTVEESVKMINVPENDQSEPAVISKEKRDEEVDDKITQFVSEIIRRALQIEGLTTMIEEESNDVTACEQTLDPVCDDVATYQEAPVDDPKFTTSTIDSSKNSPSIPDSDVNETADFSIQKESTVDPVKTADISIQKESIIDPVETADISIPKESIIDDVVDDQISDVLNGEDVESKDVVDVVQDIAISDKYIPNCSEYVLSAISEEDDIVELSPMKTADDGITDETAEDLKTTTHPEQPSYKDISSCVEKKDREIKATAVNLLRYDINIPPVLEMSEEQKNELMKMCNWNGVYTPGCKFLGKVTNNLHSDGTFWLRHDYPNVESRLQILQERLQIFGESSPAPCITPTVGTFVLAQFQKIWYRALIENVDPRNMKVKVRLMDSGTSARVHIDQLNCMPMVPMPPFQAVRCAIGSQELAYFSKDSIKFFEKFTKGKTFLTEVVVCSPEGLVYVRLVDLQAENPANVHVYEHLYSIECQRKVEKKLKSGNASLPSNTSESDESSEIHLKRRSPIATAPLKPDLPAPYVRMMMYEQQRGMLDPSLVYHQQPYPGFDGQYLPRTDVPPFVGMLQVNTAVPPPVFHDSVPQHPGQVLPSTMLSSQSPPRSFPSMHHQHTVPTSVPYHVMNRPQQYLEAQNTAMASSFSPSDEQVLETFKQTRQPHVQQTDKHWGHDQKERVRNNSGGSWESHDRRHHTDSDHYSNRSSDTHREPWKQHHHGGGKQSHHHHHQGHQELGDSGEVWETNESNQHRPSLERQDSQQSRSSSTPPPPDGSEPGKISKSKKRKNKKSQSKESLTSDSVVTSPEPAWDEAVNSNKDDYELGWIEDQGNSAVERTASGEDKTAEDNWCSVCARKGHDKLQCPIYPGFVDGQPYCSYCRTSGHTITECNIKRCKHCNGRGHNEKICRNPPFCRFCHVTGHTSYRCTRSRFDSNYGHNKSSYEPKKCYHCHEVGHISKFCPQKQHMQNRVTE